MYDEAVDTATVPIGYLAWSKILPL